MSAPAQCDQPEPQIAWLVKLPHEMTPAERHAQLYHEPVEECEGCGAVRFLLGMFAMLVFLALIWALWVELPA